MPICPLMGIRRGRVGLAAFRVWCRLMVSGQVAGLGGLAWMRHGDFGEGFRFLRWDSASKSFSVEKRLIERGIGMTS